MHRVINSSNFKNCCEKLEAGKKNFYIKDVKESSSVLASEQDHHVRVINNSNKDIFFLKIDKCVYDDGDEKKCDFALANDDKAFFVEVKELERFDDSKKRNKKRSEAKQQLIKTINLFKEKYPGQSLMSVVAVIALLPKLEDDYVKILSVKDQLVTAAFIDECGCPNIYEGNLIEF